MLVNRNLALMPIQTSLLEQITLFRDMLKLYLIMTPIMILAKRGAYYYFNWVRDGTDNSTRVTVNNEFVGTGDLASTKVLLFDHSKQYIRVTIQNGNVTSVQIEDA